MGKYISWIAIFLLLVIVPFGSWYYLGLGLDYRKDALKDLVAKDSLVASNSVDLQLKGKTTILVMHDSDNVRKVLEPIKEQFANVTDFQIIFFDSLKHEGLQQWSVKYDKYSFLLVDQTLKLRNYYNDDMDAIKKMIEHTAIVIPRPKEADIHMK